MVNMSSRSVALFLFVYLARARREGMKWNEMMNEESVGNFTRVRSSWIKTPIHVCLD